MPVLASTDVKITPRSALRHRPIGEEGFEPGTRATGKTPVTPVAQRASRSNARPSSNQGEIDEWQRETGKGAPASRTPATQWASTTAAAWAWSKTSLPTLSRMRRAVSKRHVHPLLYLGLGMLAMLLLWLVFAGVISWVGTTMDDMRYGRPRTFQIDEAVGHGDSKTNPSHFIALNLHGHIEVIELPGGDAAHARMFLGPLLIATGSELVPVTLSFADVNGEHKPDMLINVQESQFVFINDQGTFRPMRSQERQQIEQFLHHPVQ